MVEVLHSLSFLWVQAEGLTRAPYCRNSGQASNRMSCSRPRGQYSAGLALPDDPLSASWRLFTTPQTSIARPRVRPSEGTTRSSWWCCSCRDDRPRPLSVCCLLGWVDFSRRDWEGPFPQPEPLFQGVC